MLVPLGDRFQPGPKVFKARVAEPDGWSGFQPSLYNGNGPVGVSSGVSLTSALNDATDLHHHQVRATNA